ncbi:MFS transporter [Gynuella sp.]|uniref:MFS transporter n=1 Tax=Gynuella sp. TaxID=2969146 RepID=UPI003D101C19
MKKLTMIEKVGYGFGDLASNVVFTTVGTYLMFFYTDVFGISAAIVGTLFFVTRMWDAISDPVMGIIGDRTESRWGKFRPYLLFTPVPLAIVAVITFTTPDISESGKVIWAFASYIALMTLYTVINIPYSSLPPMITDSAVERGELASYRMLLAFTGGLLVNAGTIPLMNYFGDGNQQLGYQRTMMLFSVIMMVLFFVCFALVRERVPPLTQTSSLKSDFKVVMRNRAYWTIIMIGVPVFALLMAPFAVGMYFFSYNVGDQSAAAPFFTLGTLGMIAGAVVCIFAVKKICKRTLMIIALIGSSLTISQIYWLDPENLRGIYTIIFINQFFLGISATNLWGLVGDTADYIEWRSGRRVVGLATSSATFSHKFGMGLGGALVGFALSSSGYVAGAEQTPEALNTILLFMSLVPGAGALVIAFITSFYPVTRKISEQAQAELTVRRSLAISETSGEDTTLASDQGVLYTR